MVQITITEVLNDLTNGLSRHDIKAKYNLSPAQLKQIFSHPKLKGKKAKKAEVMIDLIDDTITESTVVVQGAELQPTPVVSHVSIEEVVEEVGQDLFN